MYSVQLYYNQQRRCEEILQQLHSEYFQELLLYTDEFAKFKSEFKMDDLIKSKRKDKETESRKSEIQQSSDIKKVVPKFFQKNLSKQFGTKAPEKLQRLLFLLRDCKDVFEVFSSNLHIMICEEKALYFVESLVHHMF